MMRYSHISLVAVLCLFVGQIVAQDVSEESLSLEGQWQAYNEIDGAVTQRLPIRYVFGKVGWGIKEGEKDVVVQDWYRALGNRLLLRYSNLPTETHSNAVICAALEKNSFRVQDPVRENRKILFERMTQTKGLSMKDIKGRYFIEQRRSHANEFEKSPFSILVDENGFYRFEPIPTNGASYARGQIILTNECFVFMPHSQVKGFWDRPKFFPYQNYFVYDNPFLAIRLVREK